jgi:hypothetical protein
MLYQGCWFVICKQAVQDVRIFAAAKREKYENMVFIRQDEEFRLDNLITCKEGLLLSLMNAYSHIQKNRGYWLLLIRYSVELF